MGLASGAGWEVAEVEMDGVTPREVAVAVRVQEYRFWGSWARPQEGGPCRLLATRWTRRTEPGRGEGLYIEGEWLRLRGSTLQRDPARPLVEQLCSLYVTP
ncbi:MAG TPA: hypothetical protein VHG28_13105 [Longimicrobiaceae bacterium]|nr:hypothetical protein [Longimicrobiaceae bacterium]